MGVWRTPGKGFGFLPLSGAGLWLVFGGGRLWCAVLSGGGRREVLSIFLEWTVSGVFLPKGLIPGAGKSLNCEACLL